MIILAARGREFGRISNLLNTEARRHGENAEPE